MPFRTLKQRYVRRKNGCARVLLIAASCFVLGASLIYLLQGERGEEGSVSAVPGDWEKVIQKLIDEDERGIVQIVADGGEPSSRASLWRGVVSPRVRSA